MANNNAGYGKEDDAARRRADAMQKKANKKQYDEDEYDDDEAARKAGKGCLVAFLVVLLIVAGILLTGFLYIRGELNGSNADATGTVTVEVPGNSGGTAVAGILKDAGLIGNEAVFRFYVRFNGAGGGFQKGVYELESGMSYDELIEALSQAPAPKETIQVMIPKGSTVVQFGQKLAEAGLCTVEDFVAAANNLEEYSDISFISKLLEEGFDESTYMRAEGYLTPDTYDFYVDDTPENYARRLFEQTEINLGKLTTLEEGQDVYTLLAAKDMTLHDLFTLASMVEEEASEVDDNQGMVAGVYWNRMSKDLPAGAAGRRMECDATLLYIRDWIARDYGDDVDSVPESLRLGYDTYEREGLPVGPISSPGPTALQAALTPVVHSDFYYFVDPEGAYHYNQTFSGHQADINRYGVKGQEQD